MNQSNTVQFTQNVALILRLYSSLRLILSVPDFTYPTLNTISRWEIIYNSYRFLQDNYHL